MATPDPYNSQGVKSAMARRVPTDGGWAAFNSDVGNFLKGTRLPGESVASAEQFGPSAVAAQAEPRASQTAAAIAADKAAAVASTKPPAAPAPTDAPTMNYNVPAPAPAGMQRLAAGVVRAPVNGVYMARMKDGSMGFSNVLDANGQPTFTGSPGVDPRMEAAARAIGARGSGGTQVDPRYRVPDGEGWAPGAGAQAGTPDRYAGQVDATGPGALHAPTIGKSKYTPQGTPSIAGYTYATASNGANANDISKFIDANHDNPLALQGAIQTLAARADADRGSGNPNVTAANEDVLARLSAARDDAMSGGMSRRNMGMVPATGSPTLNEFAQLEQAGMMGGGASPVTVNGTSVNGASYANGSAAQTPFLFGRARTQAELDLARAEEQRQKGQAEVAGASQGQQKIDNAQIAALAKDMPADDTGVPAELAARIQYVRNHPELAGSPTDLANQQQLAAIMRAQLAQAGNGWGANTFRALGFNMQPTHEDPLDPNLPFAGITLDGGDVEGPIHTNASGDEEQNIAHTRGLLSSGPVAWAADAIGRGHGSTTLYNLLRDPRYGPLIRAGVARDNALYAQAHARMGRRAQAQQ